MNDTSILQILVQAGAVGIAISLIYVVYKLVSNHDAHMLEALDRNTTAWIENAKIIQKLVDKL